MSLNLSAPDLRALEQAQTALLSPLDYRNTDAWRVVASARVAQLIGADQAAFTPPRTILRSRPQHANEADLEGADVACGLDTAGANSRLRRRVEANRRFHLYRATLGAIEIYVDWSVPNHLEMEGLAIDPFPGELLAGQHVNHGYEREAVDRETSGAFGERGLTYLRLLLPAFKAGVRTLLTFRVHREALACILDRIADGAAVWDREGNRRYRNGALDDLLAADAERAVLERRLADVARRLLARRGHRATAMYRDGVTVVTGANTYRLRPAYAAGLAAGEPWVLVLVRAARRLPPAALLRTRYGLTPRQSEVAQRLAEGQTDVAIARALGISRRTAEHHAEAVRLSIGVHSRAALAAALQQSV